MKKYFSAIFYSCLMLPLVSVVVAYIFNLSIWLGFIISCCVVIAAQIVHLPEDLPGGYDNQDGNEVHPYWVLAFMVVLILLLIGMASIFPELVNSPGFKSDN